MIHITFDALEEQTPKLIEENKLNFIGDISRFNKKLIERIKKFTKRQKIQSIKFNHCCKCAANGTS